VELTIPAYVERIATKKTPCFWAASLFIDQFERTNAREDRALSQLEGDLRRAVNQVSASMRHDDIAYWSYSPPLTSHKERLHIPLRKHSSTCVFFFAVWEAMGRRLAISPRLPNLCFEWPRGIPLQARATEVLLAYFRDRERAGDESNARPEDFAAGPGARLTHIRITSHTTQRFKEDRERDLAHLAADEKMSGAEELEKVGRCLNRRFPHDLARAKLREPETCELLSLFENPKTPPAPVVLVGRSQVGKSTVIHEFLYRTLSAEKRPLPELWLISPQRVISGMSFVGQWEERLHAILKFATARGLLLYFDDLLGLYQAGRSRDSDLSVGHLLHTHLEENPLAVIAEATPEAWARLREIDRGFADRFHVIHIREPSESDTLRTLVGVIQDIEGRLRCHFSPDTLPLVVALQRRFARSRAFPGKAAEMLRHVASSHPEETISRETIYDHFSSRTGINPLFLDEEKTLDRPGVQAFFKERIMGQDAAVEAMIGAALMSKARLNDPSRPVASLLFLGPTGVGKTECAKALAEFFFGSADKMVRFDFNEYGGPDATLRLIGSFARPGGQLTGAIRRNPYTVLLLDEIEKANPEVFDLLLQVLGDGRLTDANGLTADFCNTIIIMTSNLGAQETGKQVGFGTSSTSPSRVYHQAAEAFFRPELFNRLDRVIAFHPLEKEHIKGLASRLVERTLSRPGISQRRLDVSVAPSVYDGLVDRGFVPEYGARALRRSIEDHLITPLALAVNQHKETPGTTLVISSGTDGLDIRTISLEQAHRTIPPPPDPTPTDVISICEEVTTFLRSTDAELDGWDTGDNPVATAYYYSLRDERLYLRQRRDQLLNFAEALQRTPGRRKPPPKKPPLHTLTEQKTKGLLSRIQASSDPAGLLLSLGDEAQLLSALACETRRLQLGTNQLQTLCDRSYCETETVTVQFGGTALPPPDFVNALLLHFDENAPTLDESPPEIILEGHALGITLDLLSGTHLTVSPDGEFSHFFLTRGGDTTPPPVTHIHIVSTGQCLDLVSGILCAPLHPPLHRLLLPLFPQRLPVPTSTL